MAPLPGVSVTNVQTVRGGRAFGAEDGRGDGVLNEVLEGRREHRVAGHKGYRTEVLAFGAGRDLPTKGRTQALVKYIHAPEPELTMGFKMIILGLILLIIGLLVGMGLLTTIGGILILVGAILWILGATGRAVGGRKHFF
ncbi:hypothetical protein [Streptomyces sp. SID5643]|nr:hypothetical protein [Streptomyces sp. SID5643]